MVKFLNKKRVRKDGFGIDKFGTGIDKFDVELTKWNRVELDNMELTPCLVQTEVTDFEEGVLREATGVFRRDV